MRALNNSSIQNANLANNARGQYLNELYAERNQPLNEIGALLSGSQVQNPNFVSTPTTGVNGVDYTGLVNQQYQSELANSQSAMGGLFGLLSSGVGLLKSDRRLKRDIERIGAVGRLPWYRFNYVWDLPGSPTREGFMSDEVRLIAPHAVTAEADGYDAVDYDIAVEAA